MLFGFRVKSVFAGVGQGNSLGFTTTFVFSCKVDAVLVEHIPVVVVSLIQGGVQSVLTVFAKEVSGA